MIVYSGTYTYPGKSEGIYILQLDEASGALERLHTVAGVADPAFLAFDPSQRLLVSVNWLKPHGAVSSFRIEPDGKLAFLSKQPSGGAAPCHLCIDPTGRHVLVANHDSGTVAVLPLAADGTLGPPSDVKQHVGSGPKPAQEGPHAHFVGFDPAGVRLLVCDKGCDQVMVYRLEAGRLLPAGVAQLHPGAGPRHLAFIGHRLYVNNEQDSTLSLFRYPSLEHVRTVSTVPDGYGGANTTSEIAAHPSGRCVYVSNRGHDSIAIFTPDLEAVERVPSGGKTPRFFALDPAGRWLFACNQNSDTIVTFRVEGERLEPTGQVLDVPSPTCLIFKER